SSCAHTDVAARTVRTPRSSRSGRARRAMRGPTASCHSQRGKGPGPPFGCSGDARTMTAPIGSSPCVLRRVRRLRVAMWAGHSSRVFAQSRTVCYAPGEMFEVRQETMVAAAHQLRLSPGEGERLHGHNWRIVAVIRCRELDSRGMVVDFNDLGVELRRLV